jgi:hypothetical protein
MTLAVSAAALSTACNRNAIDQPPALPSAPTPLPPLAASFAGAWHGDYTVTRCEGQRHCNETRGRAYPFSLRLEQAGSHVRGLFMPHGIPVEGDVSSDGELSLTGTRPSAGKYSPAVELTRFTARLSPTGLVADLVYQMRYEHGMRDWIGGNSLEQSLGGTVASAERGTITPVSSFDGQWTGTLIISDCSTIGWTACWPEERDREYGFELTLTQSGNRVSGELRLRDRFQVTGTVSGDTLTLEPAVREDVQSGSRIFTRLERWEMTRDAVGSVRGEMYYKRDTVWTSGQPSSQSAYYAKIVYGIPAP